jgi:hypothetical protein
MKRPQQVSAFPFVLVAACLAVLVLLCAGPELVEAKPTTAIPVFRKSARPTPPSFTAKPRTSSKHKYKSWITAATADWDVW